LLTLSYSRAQETEADDLGITYIGRAGYDPAALSTVLASLAAQNALDARAAGIDARAVPAWASTHPEPEARVRRALAQAQALHITNGRLNRDPFLNALNTVMYGDDPHQGVVEGQEFTHPDMRLRFSVPAGFHMSNGTQAVSISSATGQAQFSTGAYTGDLDAYVRQAFQAVVGQNQQGATLGAITHSTINGLPVATASAQATSQSGTVTLTIVAYEFARDKAYHFAAIAPAGQSAQFDPMFASLRRITDAEAAAVRPRRVSVVTVGRADTMQSLASRMAYPSLQLERFQVLNGLTASSTLRAGQRVKIVVSAAR